MSNIDGNFPSLIRKRIRLMISHIHNELTTGEVKGVRLRFRCDQQSILFGDKIMS